MVNPRLASTAVGVVTPERSGMASGVNTTFRQIGIATGIAAYLPPRTSLSGRPVPLPRLLGPDGCENGEFERNHSDPDTPNCSAQRPMRNTVP